MGQHGGKGVMATNYLSIKVTVAPLGSGRYRSRIEQAELGASEGPGFEFTLDSENDTGVTGHKHLAVREFQQRLGAGSLSSEDQENFGTWLFGLLFGEKVREKYSNCQTVAKQRGARLRFALALLDPKLTEIPWEYLHDGADFLLRQNHSIVRVLDELQEGQAPFQPIQKLLFAIANPTRRPNDYPPFDAEGHENSMRERFLRDIAGLEVSYVRPATRDAVRAALRSERYDAVYFVGHGEFTEPGGGQLIFEDGAGDRDRVSAGEFASWLQSAPSVRFVYLNSCSTAQTTSTSAFAGVAQRAMLSGDIGAILAMQARVPQNAALDMAQGFFQELYWGASPEEAVVKCRDRGGTGWGIPVVYTYLSGPEYFERNRLACLLNAKTGDEFRLLLACVVKGGILVEDADKVKVTLDPANAYHYPGETFARTDIMAAQYILNLLTQVSPPERIKIYPSHEKEAQEGTHFFAFGSKSNEVATGLLNNYSPSFRFHDNHPKFPGEWVLEDLDDNEFYHIKDPSTLSVKEYGQIVDYGVIQKAIDPQSGRTFFMIFGLGDRATQGCGWYLWQRWEELLKVYGSKGFGVILKFPSKLAYSAPTRISRRADQKTRRFAGEESSSRATQL
jgi:hypothetical protein